MHEEGGEGSGDGSGQRDDQGGAHGVEEGDAADVMGQGQYVMQEMGRRGRGEMHLSSLAYISGGGSCQVREGWAEWVWACTSR